MLLYLASRLGAFRRTESARRSDECFGIRVELVFVAAVSRGGPCRQASGLGIRANINGCEIRSRRRHGWQLIQPTLLGLHVDCG